MTAPGRALKRPHDIKQRQLLKKYRKRIKKLKSRAARQRYRLLQNTLLRLETAWNRSPNPKLAGAMSRLHARLVACREQFASDRKNPIRVRIEADNHFENHNSSPSEA